MAEPFTIHVDDGDVKRLLAGLPAKLAQDVAYKAVSMLTAETEGQIKEAVSGGTLKNRSGQYAQSITSTVEQQGTLTRGSIGTTFVGANLQEKGGTVSPKSKKWLTVPVGAALTGAGVKRFDAPTALRQGAFFPTKAGGAFVPMIARRGGPGIRAARKSGFSFVSLFTLKQSVTIPARPIWGPAFDRAARALPALVERLIAQITTAK